jgi:hypothetical protein
LIAIRLRKPRPVLRELAAEPGFLARLVPAIVVPLHVALARVGSNLARLKGWRGGLFNGLDYYAYSYPRFLSDGRAGRSDRGGRRRRCNHLGRMMVTDGTVGGDGLAPQLAAFGRPPGRRRPRRWRRGRTWSWGRAAPGRGPDGRSFPDQSLDVAPIIAMIPARIAWGSFGQAATTAARRGSVGLRPGRSLTRPGPGWHP